MEEIKETIIDNPYGFIYITTNLINGKRYLGQKTFDKNGKWRNYLGSGKVIKNAIKYYGKENFARNMVCFCYSQEELNQVEYDLSVFLNVVDNPDWYNLEYGGNGCSGYRHTEETKKHLSEVFSGENHPWFGKHHSEESKRKMSESRKGVEPANKGQSATEETKQKLRDAWLNRPRTFSEEVKQKMSEAHKGEKNHNYGKTMPEEVRKKISENHADVSGENNPNYGKPRSEETKRKISEKAKDRYKDKTKHPTYGRHLSDEQKQKLSECAKQRVGEKNPNYGKGMVVVQLTLDGEFINEYPSSREADKATGVNHATIFNKCKHRTKTQIAGGYLWMSKEEYLTQQNNLENNKE